VDIDVLKLPMDEFPGFVREMKVPLAIDRNRAQADGVMRDTAGNSIEIDVVVPDDWPSIQLAPLYDVHIGAAGHDEQMFDRHLAWLRDTPNVLTWGGGDLIENASKMSVGAGVYEQTLTPQMQVKAGILKLASISHKMLFNIPGNHEDRAALMGLSVSEFMAGVLEIPQLQDYSFTTIHWRDNHFRILAHHGAGSAVTAGAQRMAARKPLAWAKPFDLYWTGHLHNPLVDVLYQTDRDQATGRMFERTALIIISPSYLKYFGTYAASKLYPPGPRGLAVVELQADGRMDVSLHAHGRRL
jgi:hypothetical protein